MLKPATAVETLAALKAAGVRLWVDGDRLRYECPSGALTPELRAAVAACRSELFDLIEASDTGTALANRAKLSAPDEQRADPQRINSQAHTGPIPAPPSRWLPAEAPINPAIRALLEPKSNGVLTGSQDGPQRANAPALVAGATVTPNSTQSGIERVTAASAKPTTNPSRWHLRRWGKQDAGPPPAFADIDHARWFGKQRDLPDATLEQAWRIICTSIPRFFPRAMVQTTPAGTGTRCIEHTLPYGDGERPYEYPALPDELKALLHHHSPQHRISQTALVSLETAATTLAVYDRRIAYVAHLRHLPTARTLTRDCEAIYEPHRPGLYRVAVEVPASWQHIGLVPYQEPARDVTGQRLWSWPAEPGATFESWINHRELGLLVDNQWPYEIRERILFDPPNGPGSDPLRQFSERIRGELDRLGLLPPDPIRKALMAAYRAIGLQTIGLFHKRDVLVPYDDDAELVADFDAANGDMIEMTADGRFARRVARSESAMVARWHRPEWSSEIWAASRVTITKKALSLPREHIALIDSDALYLLADPAWPDSGKVGAFRHEGTWTRETARPVPATLADYRQIKAGRAVW